MRIFLCFSNYANKGGQDKGAYNEDAKQNAIPTEYLEIVFLYEVHQELDRGKGNGKSNNGAD